MPEAPAIERLPLSKLKPAAYNPRKIDEANLARPEVKIS